MGRGEDRGSTLSGPAICVASLSLLLISRPVIGDTLCHTAGSEIEVDIDSGMVHWKDRIRFITIE